MSHRRTMQILPDSTGKKLVMHHHFRLEFTNQQPGEAFSVGDTVVGGTSGVSMIVNRSDETVTPKEVFGTLELASEHSDFTDGEQLLVEGTYIADASGAGEAVYLAPQQVVSYDNPFNGQSVDASGAAFVRFAEGAQEFDAIGRSLVAEFSLLADYSFRYGVTGGGNEGISAVTAGAGTISGEANTGSFLESVGTASGDLASGASEVRHTYEFGQSLLSYFVLAVGDQGKTNVRRQWGLFDDDNGYFFELNGTTLSVVTRGDSTGSPVDVAVPASLWNKDRLDGATGIHNKSGIQIDVSKINGWWIDINYGVRVRFGIMGPQGGRIAIHETPIANQENIPSVQSTSLPMTMRIDNTGTSASGSEIRAWYGVCGIEGVRRSVLSAPSQHALNPNRVTITNTEVPLLSIRPKLTFAGKASHIKSVPVEIYTAAIGAAGEQFIIRIREDEALTGASFASHAADSAVEVDTSATVVATTKSPIAQFFSEVGVQEHQLANYFSEISKHLHILADGVTQMTYTLTAQSVDAVPGTIDLCVQLEWHELL